MMNFIDIGVNENIILGLQKQEIIKPTEIQSLVIPAFLQKKDIIVRSETGSGKTLAYLIPLFLMVDTEKRCTQAIILTPTHELASQVYKQAQLLAKNSDLQVKTALIIGGASYERQIEKLKQKPQIVIGSSGRILDLIKKRKISAHTTKTIVIDEADRMIDTLNLESVKAVIKTTLKERQLVLLSASISDEIQKEAKKFMKEPIFITSKNENTLPEGIEHFYIKAQRREKFDVLRKIINSPDTKKAIVFINNTENIEVIVEKLNFHNIKAMAIYGNVYENERRIAIDNFRTGRIKVLVSSDLSARGLDIDDITHVINIDIPENPIYYLHRAGRTARAGKKGLCISIITDYEKKFINRIERDFKIKFYEKEMKYGKLSKVKKSGKNKKETYKKNSISDPFEKFKKRNEKRKIKNIKSKY